MLAELLVSNGADVNHRDRYGRTPLSNSVIYDHVDTVEMLLDRGASIDDRGASIDARGALMTAERALMIPCGWDEVGRISWRP